MNQETGWTLENIMTVVDTLISYEAFLTELDTRLNLSVPVDAKQGNHLAKTLQARVAINRLRLTFFASLAADQ
jgi:hypothetical protein